MDHLPQPRGSPTELLWVPFLVDIDVDEHESEVKGSKKFRSYPKDRNFIFEDRSAQDIACFIQGWLYFGLLGEVLGKLVNRSKFCVARFQGTEQQTYLSSVALKEVVPQPIELEEDSDTEDESSLFAEPPDHEEVGQFLRFARKRCDDIDRMHHSAKSPLPEVLLSIKVLIDTLRHVMLGWATQRLDAFMNPTFPQSATVDLLANAMKGTGWCPFQINHIFQNFHTPLVYYISQIRRQGRPNITHLQCSLNQCVAYNIADKKHVTKHTEACLGCNCGKSFVSIPRRDMRNIVHEGGIPLAFIERRATGEVSLGVKRASSQDTYVAFSHVWSDGLGNPLENALPRCQLERLDKYMAKLSTPSSNMARGTILGMDVKRMRSISRTKLFWLDSLCIPVRCTGDDKDEDRKTKELKQKAINKIAAIFAGASRVIVLDSEMEKFRLEGADSCEVSARFLFSAWTGRCWTLEEGALSQAPHVECADGAYDPNSYPEDEELVYALLSSTNATSVPISFARLLWKGATSLLPSSIDRSVSARFKMTHEFERRIQKMLRMPLRRRLREAFLQQWKGTLRDNEGMAKPWDYFNQFYTCWNALSRRSTSRSNDRLSILANLLDLNTFQLTKSPLPMLNLLRSLPGVPVSMLWNETISNDAGESETNESCDYGISRWLPRYPSRVQLGGGPPMVRTDGGLKLDVKPAPNRDIVHPQGTSILLIQPALPNSSEVANLLVQMPGKYFRYRVQFTSQGSGNPLTKICLATCLLFPKDHILYNRELMAGSSIQGACLQVSDIIEERLGEDGDQGEEQRGTDAANPTDLELKLRLSTLYDCPARIWLIGEGKGQYTDGDAIPCKEVWGWSLTLCCGKSTLHFACETAQQQFACRPNL